MRIIVVGNGPTLLDVKNGKRIDEFDIVVRFNNYTLNNFEDFVGRKTNYWFNTISERKSPNSTLDRIIWHSWHWDETTDQNYQKFLKNYPNAEKTKRDTILEMQEYVEDKKYFTYSTGAIAIWMLLKEHDKLTITGFDWWNEKTKHHYHNNQKIGGIHLPEKELVFVSKLISEGKVEFL